MRVRVEVEIVQSEDGAPVGDARIQICFGTSDRALDPSVVAGSSDPQGGWVVDAEIPDSMTLGVVFVRARGRAIHHESFEISHDVTAAELPRVVRLHLPLRPGRTLGGIVLDQGGRPLAGARVCLVRNRSSRCGGRPAVEWVRADAVSLRRGGPSIRAFVDRRIDDPCVTDSDGRFMFHDVAFPEPSPWGPTLLLIVEHDEYRTASLHGVERWPIETEAGTRAVGSGDDIGHAEIPVRLEAIATSSPRSVGAGAASREEGLAVRGVVREIWDWFDRDFCVVLEDSHGRNVASTSTGVDGSFSLEKVPVDLRLPRISVRTPNWKWSTGFEVDASVHELVPPPLASVELWLRDPTLRSPIPSREIRWRGAPASCRFDLPDFSAYADFDAHGRVILHAPIGTTPTIEIGACGYLPKTVEIASPLTRAGLSVEVALEKGATWVVQVCGKDRSPLAGALVGGYDVRHIPPQRVDWKRSDAAGRVELCGMSAESRLVVLAPHYAPDDLGASDLVRSNEDVSAGVDATERSIVLRTGGTITGTVRREDGSPALHDIVVAIPSRGPVLAAWVHFWDRVQANGAYRIDHVPPGSFELRVGGESRQGVLSDGETFLADFVLRS